MQSQKNEGKILREYLVKRFNTMDEVSEMLGYSTRQGLYFQLGKKKLSGNFVQLLKDKLEIEADAVIKWDGDMPESQTKPTGEDIRRKKAIGEVEDNGLIYVPIMAQAGYSKNYMDPIYVNQLERLFVPGLPYTGDKYRYFEVEGDSMHPTIEEGMQVIARLKEPDVWRTSIDNYYIHVIVTDSQVLIKRLYRKNDKEFVMISDNELYPQAILPMSEIKELWVVKRMLDWRMAPPKQVKIVV
jgi:phage repressor protein C with HTH and peptisase S24 domain